MAECPSSPNKVHQFAGSECIWCGVAETIEVEETYPEESFPGQALAEVKKRIREMDTGDEFVPGTSISVEWHRWYPDLQQRIWMKPLDVLGYMVAPCYGDSLEYPYGFSEHSLKGLDEAFAKGEPMFSLLLDVDIDRMVVTEHEGRHRAYWAYKKDIEKLPVALLPKRKGRFVKSAPIDMSQVKSQVVDRRRRGVILAKYKGEDPKYQGKVLRDWRTAKDVALGIGGDAEWSEE